MSETRIKGELWAAFPGQARDADGTFCAAYQYGITRLDYFAAHAALTAEDAYALWHHERPTDVAFGAEFMAFWARKRVALARAMVAEIAALDHASEPTP